MLVLRRDLDPLDPAKSVVVMTCPDGTKIEVRLIQTGNGWCKLGFEAPKSVQIGRLDRRFDGRGEVCRG